MDSGMETGANAASAAGGDAAEVGEDLVLTFGTAEPPVPWRRISLGPLSFLLSDQSIRRICWHGTELVRAISWPIRDENWATYPATTLHDATARSDERMTGRIEQSVAGGRLGLVVEFSASAAGELSVTVTMTPAEGPFATNRAGLTVLHPILGLTGAPVTVTHSDGSTEATFFPKHIKPSQPMGDITGLAYAIGAAQADIRFEGEVFEMEDQRNWSDASYKTYCVPLKEPFTYEIDAPITQTVRVSLSGEVAADRRSAATPAPQLETLDRVAPALGLALEEGWLGGAEMQETIGLCGASHLLLRIEAATSPAFLAKAATLASALAAPIDTELLLEDDATEGGLVILAARLEEAGIAPRRVIALRRSYLQSYQPTAQWPEGPRPDALIKAVRQAFLRAQVGGGVLTNFTEFNRCRPDPALCDFIFHGNSATVHAADDLSVAETLEALPQVYASAQALSGGQPYRLGLVSIGMRTNPYGTSVSENLEQRRETMASPDPRLRGLFGAAWAVGVLASTEGSAVEALCLAAPTGPFGLVPTPQPYAQFGFDEGERCVVPLFHVARAACEMAGNARVTLRDLPTGVMAYGAVVDGCARLMVANLSQSARTLPLPKTARVSLLDRASAAAAMADPRWLDSTPEQRVKSLELTPYSVAFVMMELEE
ncbi:hypothetical protein [Vannielia sp. SX4]|uniref:hypothetical protein n=1 Tax=Vannielia sp. SX4 TaxID=3463852 RepID=UPI0040590901